MGPAPPASPLAPRATPNPWPFQHGRLLAYFVALAVGGGAIGSWFVARAPQHATAVVVVAVAGTAALGFVGVLLHRLRVLPLRWRETESYLIAIRRESERYRALMKGAGDALLIVDPRSGRVHEWNDRACEDLGLPVTAQAPIALDTLFAPGELQRLSAALRDAADRPGSVLSLRELGLRSSSGRPRVADARLAAIALQAEQVVLVSLNDLTQQKEMETQLQMRERLSAIGMLTAGVAHEVNNPLEGIANHLLLLERADADPQARKRHLEQVRHGFGRVREIVRDLLRFARPAQVEQGRADLAAVARNASKLAHYSERGKNIEMGLPPGELAVWVGGDPGRLEQVVFNLLLNAATAMNGSGRVDLSVRRNVDEAGNAWGELTVADTGPGIPPEHLERIFDPFFTTTGGTGLGLSVSYGIVRAHGGELSASNDPRGGARFTLRLPLEANA